MINNRDTLDKVFQIVKQVKKPLVKIYPNGNIIGTDEQFASINILKPIMSYNLNLEIPYIFNVTEFTAFMRTISAYVEELKFTPYDINMDIKISRNKVERISLFNYVELNTQFDDLFNKAIDIQYKNILLRQDDINKTNPEMLSMKVADGAKMFHINKFTMTSFNVIHPANKTDKVDLIIRDYDEYSYVAEFMIYKKKDNYVLHEYIRFRKI